MTGPKTGEYWIVEFRGEVTIAQPIADGERWQYIGEMKGHAPDDTFRAIRRLDLVALVDREDVAKDRLIWLLIEAAGGKIEINRRTLQEFDADRAEIETWQFPSDGSQVYVSKLRAKEDDRTNSNDDRGRSPRAS